MSLWFYADQVTINNGSLVVEVTSGEDISIISAGDGLIVGSFAPVEIKRAYIDGSNNKFIELALPWGDSNQTSVNARGYYTAGDFIAATKALQDASLLLSGNFSALDEWGTGLGTVDFVNQAGETKTARTMLQMDADVQAIQDNNQTIIDNAVSDSIAAIRYGKLDNPLVHLFKKNKLVDTLQGELSWTRDSGATYIDRYGKLQYSPSPYATNLFAYSEDFDHTYWTKVNSTLEVDSAPSMAGRMVADTLVPNDGVANTSVRVTPTVSDGATLTLSVFSSDIMGFSNLQLLIGRSGATSFGAATFDVSNGTQIKASSAISSSMVKVGNGYRCSVTVKVNDGITTPLCIIECDDVGDGVSGIVICNAQLEESRVANGYVKTEATSVSGSSYVGIDVTRQEKEGWLLEGASTNLLAYSEDFDQWSSKSNVTVVKGEQAPDGTNDATRWTNTAAGSATSLRTAATASGQPTISIWVKSGGNGKDTFRFQCTSAEASPAIVANDEWVRYDFSAGDGGGAPSLYGIRSASDNDDVDLLIFGGQVEELSFATSYIPTTDTPTTRAADLVSFNPVGNMPHATDEFTIAYTIKSFADGWRRHWGIDQYEYAYSRASAGGDIIVTNPSNSITTAVADTPLGTRRSYIYAQDSDNRRMYIKSEGVDDIYKYQAVFNDVALDYPEPTKFVIGNSGHAYNSDEAVFGHFSDFRIYDLGFNDLESSLLTGE